jgi:predicted DNA-binding transcriptional regulator AlpA
MSTIVTIKPMYLAREEAAKLLAMSTTTLEGLAAKGEAPAPRQISKGRVAWLVEELEAWARSRPKSEMLPPENSGYGRAGKKPKLSSASSL